jgi:hypothetical protein
MIVLLEPRWHLRELGNRSIRLLLPPNPQVPMKYRYLFVTQGYEATLGLLRDLFPSRYIAQSLRHRRPPESMVLLGSCFFLWTIRSVDASHLVLSQHPSTNRSRQPPHKWHGARAASLPVHGTLVIGRFSQALWRSSLAPPRSFLAPPT